MLTPQTLGPFEVRRFLGAGGVGEVYLAYDRDRQAEVALKLVRLEGVDLEMLEAEKKGARLQQELSKDVPYVPEIFRHGEIDGFFYVSMEYVDGEDLARVTARGRLPEARALGIALQICDLLVKLHEFPRKIDGQRTNVIVHGDIKPENIRLQTGDRVRILDFGIAKHLTLGRHSTRNVFGSAPYLPPERLLHGQMDAQSDLWALIVVLYRMVAGHLPVSDSTPEVMEQEIRLGKLLPPPEECSELLRWVLRKGLLPDPKSRHQTARALKEELEAVRDGLSADKAPLESLDTRPTRPGNTPPPAIPRPLATPIDSSSSVEEPPRRLESTSLRIALVVSLLLVLGLFGSQAWVWHEGKEIHRALTAETGDLDALWERYRSVERLSLFDRTLLKEPAEELVKALSASAEKTFASFRTDGRNKSDWEQAQRHLEAALSLRPDDQGLKARRIYSQGHVARVKARDLASGSASRRSLLKDAVAAFEEAAHLDPEWFDPCLGLARIYAYEKEMRDSAGLQEVESMARKRGAEKEPRLWAMLADGHLHHGRTLEARARRARGTREEQALLDEALESLVKAIRFYGEMTPTNAVLNNQREARELKGRIERRLETAGVF